MVTADVGDRAMRPKDQPIMRLFHVDKAYQSPLDVERHVTGPDGFVPVGGLLREHGLHAGRGAGQADLGPWVEPPGGLL